MTIDRQLTEVLRAERRATRKIKPRRSPSYWARHKREKCSCIGYHFPHRRGSGACEHSARQDFYIALRQGATLAEAMERLSVDQLERMFPLQELNCEDDDDIPIHFSPAAPAH